jgi:hypothetical protein
VVIIPTASALDASPPIDAFVIGCSVEAVDTGPSESVF